MHATVAAPVNCGLASTFRLTSGCGARSSHRMKPNAASTARKNSPMMKSDCQPSRCPFESPVSRQPRAVTRRVNPIQFV